MSLVSRTLGFCYIRVPRTGSSTFVHYLQTSLDGLTEEIGAQHASALEMRPIIGEAQWAHCHTFGFIRNPWAWLVSMYNANISEGAWGKEALPGGPGPKEYHRANLPFDEWLEARQTTPMDWLSDRAGDLLVDEVRTCESLFEQARVCVGAKNHSTYQEWYTEAMRDYVADKCHREIATGKYTFE